MASLKAIEIPVHVLGLDAWLAELEAREAALRADRRRRVLTIAGLVLVLALLAYGVAGLLGVAVGGGLGG